VDHTPGMNELTRGSRWL